MTTPDPQTMKANDRKPVVRDLLTYREVDAGDALAVQRRDAALAELSTTLAAAGTVVSFVMGAADDQWNPLPGVAKVNKRATVVSATDRVVEYAWAAGDTDTPGRWLYEWEVVDAAGLPQTFPGDGYNRLAIGADLDADGSAPA